ncbi:MAG: hypothetical protein ACKV1O_22045 [Saprospiraceae bacterium]
MKTSHLIPGALFLLLLFPACQKNSLESQFNKLPELPQDVAATLDTNTMATAARFSFVERKLDPAIALAPCCSTSDRKALKVTFPYTKCAPLRSFIMVPGQDLVFMEKRQGAGQTSNNSAPQADRFKYSKLSKLGTTIRLDKIVCVTSEGPWDALLTEERTCSQYAPQNSLVITAFDNLVVFEWNGGIEFHPANIGLVSCRQIGVIRSSCSGLSSCNCLSSYCPETEPCVCNLDGIW